MCLEDNGKFFIDARAKKNQDIVITHAHSDHAKTTTQNRYFMSKGTSSLIKKGKKSEINEIPFKKKFSLGEFSVSLHNAGHILGSSQLKVEGNKTVVFTSDFKLQDSILFKGAEIIPSDILVIESTFGAPQHFFPEREIVYAEMKKWLKEKLKENKFIVLGGYSTGKAQELTRLVNEFLGEAPFVHGKIAEQNSAYEDNGVKLGEYRKLNNNLREGNVLIMPPHLIGPPLLAAISHEAGRKVECAVATGWNGRGYKTFPLSDHADFNQLMHYVEKSNPKLVLTHHGFASQFARYVKRKLGIEARELGKKGQKTLNEFS